jgi:MinD superfamily P-loop ATPase
VSIFSTKGGTGKTFCPATWRRLWPTFRLVGGLVDLDYDLGDVFAYFGRPAGRCRTARPGGPTSRP